MASKGPGLPPLSMGARYYHTMADDATRRFGPARGRACQQILHAHALSTYAHKYPNAAVIYTVINIATHPTAKRENRRTTLGHTIAIIGRRALLRRRSERKNNDRTPVPDPRAQ